MGSNGLDTVIRSWDGKTSADVIFSELSDIVQEVLNNGLTEEHFQMLSDIFLKNTNLGLMQRKLILECLVPNFVVKEEFVNPLLLWFFSKFNSDPEASAHLLDWMGALLEYGLMEKTHLEHFYGQLVTCFQSDCLVQPLSKLLMILTNERTVNKRVSYLIQEYYQDYRSLALGNLLCEVQKLNPHLVDLPVSVPRNRSVQMTDFEKALIKRARRLGNSGPLGKAAEGKQVTTGLFPEPEYLEECPPTHKRLTSVTSVAELGRIARTFTLQLPSNPVSLLGSRIGMIYLETFGPNKEFMGGLKSLLKPNVPSLVLFKICELQNRLRHGLPEVYQYLEQCLRLWDGIEAQNIVFDLIKWAHFDNFNELSRKVLIPISRVYVCGNIELKVGILESLIDLLINMVTVHIERWKLQFVKLDNILVSPSWLNDPIRTLNRLSVFIQTLIISGLTIEGVDSSPLLLQALKFYDTTITLQFKLNQPYFTSPCSPVIYACLTTLCHVVLSEVCSLIVRYKQKVIPFLLSHGRNDEFADDIDLINVIAGTVYSYLWNDQDFSKIHITMRQNEQKLRKTPGIYLLIKGLAKKLEIKPNKLKESDIMTMLSVYCEGMEEFMKYMNEVTNQSV